MSRPQLQRMSSGTNAARPLDGRIAIVTGASRGIGSAICENLAAKGASLVMNFTSDKSEQITKDLASRIESEHGVRTLIVQADMGSEGGPAHIVALAKNHFSHPKTGKFTVHVVVNNAGVASNWFLTEAQKKDKLENFAFQYNVNVRGPLLLVAAVEPYLPHDRSGRIINVSSVSSSYGFMQQSVYGGTKAALESMTRTWSRELAERCTVNSINPGPVSTEMWNGSTSEFKATQKPFISAAPLAAVRKEIDTEQVIKDAEIAGGRAGYESEIAGTVGMLCLEDARWTTGSVICSNGGMKFSF